MKALLPIVLLFSLVAPAKALNCGDLAGFYLHYAKPNSDPTKLWLDDGYFNGYVFGFISGDNNRFFNIPNNVTAKQMAHVVGKYIQAHPEKWHLPMNQCAYDALYATWPNT